MMDIEPHHIKSEPCTTRPKYREGKKPKVVKVYTCAQESKYVLVVNIPSIGAHNELVKLFAIYGVIDEHKILDSYPCEEFTEAILIKFQKIQNARTAKIKLDNYNFYGRVLHVCYSPEHESIDDLRDKLNERKFIVDLKCKKYESIKFGTLEYDLKSSIGKHKFKKKNDYKRKEMKNEKIAEAAKKDAEQPLVCYPKLPDGWVRDTNTGDLSYDLTVNEISNKLKRTIPHQQPVEFKKRKKSIRI